MDKIVIYDTETTNSTIWGSIIEVGAVVVDKNLKEIGKLNIRGRMPDGEVPSAKALLVNSTSIDLLVGLTMVLDPFLSPKHIPKTDKTGESNDWGVAYQ